MQTDQMFIILTPNLSVCVSAVPKNSFLKILIRDESVDLDRSEFWRGVLFI